MRQVSDDHYERLAAAQSACVGMADILPALHPVRPRGMEAAGNDRYVAVLNMNHLERVRRLVAQAIGVEPADLRPVEGTAT